jgi:putative addiction module component (TIGR02574 family)
MTREQIRSAALELNPADREALAEELLLSIGDTDRESIDAAWLAEAHRRDEAYAKGMTTARPVDQVIARLQRRTAQ